MEIEGKPLVAELMPNADGYLSKITISDLQADDSFSAEQIAFDAVAPCLSYCSFALNIPMHVQQIDVTETFTGTVRIGITNGYLRSVIQMPEVTPMENELRGFLSLNREAMESSSPRYQFICVFTVIEAILARRVRLGRAEKKAGTVTIPIVEVLPITDEQCIEWLRPLYPAGYEFNIADAQSIFSVDVRGKLFIDVIENKLRPIRKNIAHALFSGGELPQSMDKIGDRRALLTFLPLATAISRYMLKRDILRAAAP
jgi:hypothetical protein